MTLQGSMLEFRWSLSGCRGDGKAGYLPCAMLCRVAVAVAVAESARGLFSSSCCSSSSFVLLHNFRPQVRTAQPKAWLRALSMAWRLDRGRLVLSFTSQADPVVLQDLQVVPCSALYCTSSRGEKSARRSMRLLEYVKMAPVRFGLVLVARDTGDFCSVAGHSCKEGDARD